MKTSQVLLSCMVITLMMPAFADDADGQHPRQQGKRDGGAKSQQTMTMLATQTSQSAMGMGIRRSPGSLVGFKSIPVAVPKVNTPNTTQQNIQRPQPQIQNEPVGNPHYGNGRDGREQSRGDYKRGDNPNYDRNRPMNNGIGSDGYVRHNDQNFTNRGYIRANNSNLSSNGYIRINQPPTINHGNTHGTYIRDRDNQGWRNNNYRPTQYRMPYREGYSDRYRVNYVQSWPINYGWRVHGWSRNYREADPYWFAVITSIALAQAWSDAEVAQAINDDRLRQQLIYDEDVRQQMIASGYPADRVDYPADGYADDPNGYPPSGYDNPYDMNSTYPPQTQNTYSAPPASSNPNSPLYNGTPLASGDQVANRNANQNVLFFCNAGNKQQTAEALRLIQSPDMSVWKTLESFNKCRSWAVLP